MNRTVLLAWRYLSFHRLRTLVLVLCIGLVFFLPAAVSLLVSHFEKGLGARADRTPLLLGAKGSRYDLVVNSLYFMGRMADYTRTAEVAKLRESDVGLVVPVYARYTAKGYPVVGTTLDYVDARGLSIERGTLPLTLGDAVLGAQVARDLGVGPGGHVISDGETIVDLSASYPLRMRVTGVLREVGTADDHAVFVDLKTAWIIEGIGHGHFDPGQTEDPDKVLRTDGDNVRLNDSVVKYTEITSENLDSFHFHEDPGRLPVTAVLIWPKDEKSRTLVRARYRVSENLQVLVPRQVIDEMMGFIFQIKRFFDANAIVVGIATALFLALIVVLSLKIREREMETLMKIGCSRFTVLKLQVAELSIVLIAGLVLAAGLSAAVFAWFAGRLLMN